MLSNFQKPLTSLLPMMSKFVTENAYSSPTRKKFYLNPPVINQKSKTIEFGRVERKPTSSKVVFWLSAKSLRSMSCVGWCVFPTVSVAKDGCILSKRKLLKLIARITLATYCQNLVEDSNRLLPTADSSTSRTARQHTAHSAQNWLRANCPDFTTKDEWPPNSSDLNPVDYHVCGAMLEAYRKLKTKQKTIAELKLKHFRLSGATCHRDWSTRLWKTSQSDWRLTLGLAVDTSNIHSDNRILASDH